MVTMWLTSSFQGFGLSRKWSLCWKNFHWHPVMFSHKLKAFIQVFKAVKGSSSSYIRECILIYKSQKQRYFWGNTENEDHKSQNKACQSQGEHFLSKEAELWRDPLSFRGHQTEWVWLPFRCSTWLHFKWQNTLLISSSLILPEPLPSCTHKRKIKMPTPHKVF